jgi:hypothetical protein
MARHNDANRYSQGHVNLCACLGIARTSRLADRQGAPHTECRKRQGVDVIHRIGYPGARAVPATRNVKRATPPCD